ncbi:DNA-directed RNA polymerase sigma-70 factor [Eubacterium sp. ER2]|uniref:DNA-directed RNA polymerase sigma-70 factor n=1 Tax=Eubacterium sp. ER2 TaxID=1519438 RepID=UPI00051C57EC|nr:DNA-directed RNA polymerase sigma-70 factor [Eubacterium sp. ER2]
MDKKVLSDYIDACKFIEETEAEIKKLEKRRRIVQDKVRGSNPEFPYEERSFSLHGTAKTLVEAGRLARERQILEDQKAEAEELKLQVEEWMQEIPFRMQRIIRYKFFKELTWEEVATLMGRKCTKESVRKEFELFMK